MSDESKARTTRRSGDPRVSRTVAFAAWSVCAMLAGGLVFAGGVVSEARAAKKQKDKEEAEVDVAEAKNQKKRPTLEDEEEGPKFDAEEFIAEKKFESIKKADEAIVHLKDLLESTPKGDPKRAEVLFNLSEMYWNKSKYYEQSAFRKQDECYAYRDSGKKEKQKQCERQMDRMLDESKRLRQEAVGLYKKIMQNYPDYEELDKILFYLGTNLEEVDKHEQAKAVFRKLLSNYPDTKYVPNVLLSLGEYYFDHKEDPEKALKFYKKVQEYEDSDVYSYAKYKAGWSYYNLQQKDRALDTFVEVIEYARNHPDQPNANALVNQARKDVVMTYADVGTPERAVPFFREIAEDEEGVVDMAERLAIKYSDDSKFDDSTKMYRKLIQMRKKSIKTVDYQYEIVRNFTTQSPYDQDSIEELVKLTKLVRLADDGQFEDYDEKEFKETRDRVEQLLRMWSTRYHREAQVTKNPQLYKMAFFLYDNYLNTFPEAENRYEMAFYNAEILYHLEKWEKAAQAYEKVLKMRPDGEHAKAAAKASVLSYFEFVKTSEDKAELESPLEFEKDDKAKEVEEGGTEEDEEVPEKKEITDAKNKLLEACKRYVEYVPDGDKIVDVKYKMARIYYEHNHLEKAVELFRDIAFNHSDHRLATIAANLHLDTLNLLNDFEGLSKAVSAYIEKKPVEDQEFRSNLDRLNRAIRFKLCRQAEDAEKWKKAANCYVEYYRSFPDSEHIDKALYNAALAFERVKELGKAIQIRVRLMKETPESDLAPKTLFNIGGNYHALAVYGKAANFYEQFVERYPDKKDLAREALANASTFRHGLGHYEKAIKDYRKYLDLFGDDEDYYQKAADIAYEIAKTYEQMEKPQKAYEQYETYIDEWGDKGTRDRLLQAHVQVGLHFWHQEEDRDRALEEFEETLEVYDQMAEEEQKKLTDGRDAAAQAKFMLAEDVNDEMVEINFENADIDDDVDSKKQLKENEKKMREIFNEKMEVAQEAQKIYEEVIKFKRPDWAIASLYKIGSQYQDFAETIRNSPVPDRLNYNQSEIYRGLLEDKASTVEKKAVSAYKRALNVAKKESWFNEYSRRAEVRLADLRPGKFQEPAELRAEPTHYHDGYERAGFIQELEGDDRQLKELEGEAGGPAREGGDSDEGGESAAGKSQGEESESESAS